jgi:acyl-coenzyme A synthetase/AMP-(fatty) acid ligase
MLPLFRPAHDGRVIAHTEHGAVTLGQFREHVAALVAHLPAGSAMINLCEDRYRYIAAYAAAVSVGHTVLMPSSRAEQILLEAERAVAGAYRFDDEAVEAALARPRLPRATTSQHVAAEHVAMVGFTSGSTGQPQRFPKLWRSVSGSTACNAAAMRAALDIDESIVPSIVATVPPQHMYGMELSVLLPLLGGFAVDRGRPLFPADVARALERVPGPRVLVTTPVHLRTLVAAEQSLPQVALIVSATAPLDGALAQAVEQRLGGTLLEMFGSTETCVIAQRRTAHEEEWQPYEGVELRPSADGTWVNAPWFSEPVMLQDVVELRAAKRFVVRGRNTDMIEVAGKRASLGDLTRRLLAIDGVKDAVVFQPEQSSVGTIQRVAALVVAPGMAARDVLDRLASSVDPAFMPRPLLIVEALPRNELGKLPKARLMSALQRHKTPGD